MTQHEIFWWSMIVGTVAVLLSTGLNKLWDGDFLKVSILLAICIFAKIPIIGRYLLYVGLVVYNWLYKEDNQNV